MRCTCTGGGNGYRLPTEAEWEKAARGGLVGQRFPWGLTISEKKANYTADPGRYSYDLGPYGDGYTNYNVLGSPSYAYGPNPGGYYAPNNYGLNDMAGNLSEWCWDIYSVPYGQPTTNNPTGPSEGHVRVSRGGSYSQTAYYARTACRSYSAPDSIYVSIGFRCVRAH